MTDFHGREFPDLVFHPPRLFEKVMTLPASTLTSPGSTIRRRLMELLFVLPANLSAWNQVGTGPRWTVLCGFYVSQNYLLDHLAHCQVYHMLLCSAQWKMRIEESDYSS